MAGRPYRRPLRGMANKVSDSRCLNPGNYMQVGRSTNIHHRIPVWDKKFIVEKHSPSQFQASYQGPQPYPMLYRSISNSSGQIPYDDAQPAPQPLFSPETIEYLRQKYLPSERLDSNEENYDYQDEEFILEHRLLNDIPDHDAYQDEEVILEQQLYNDVPNPVEILREEQDTRRKIEEIIVVAETLRKKLERDEEMKRIAEIVNRVHEEQYVEYLEPHSSPLAPHIPNQFQQTQIIPDDIPRLMDLKPVIPSLLDLNVEPPPIENVIEEKNLTLSREWNFPEKCWNCGKAGHKFVKCRAGRVAKFCYSCGKPGYNVTTCPNCGEIDEPTA